MRDILFKGKKKDNGEWVVGDLSQHKSGKMFIKTGSATQSFEVIPETVSQYTGLTDKNGNRIWENDICKTDEHRPNSVVVFKNGCFVYKTTDGDKDYYEVMETASSLVDMSRYTEVIGNIFDNPELLTTNPDDACGKDNTTEAIATDHECKCIVCGKPAKYVGVNFKVPLCSNECIDQIGKQCLGA